MDAVRRHKDRAAAYLAKGKRKQALKEYRSALDVAPGDVQLRQKLADLLLRLGHEDAAIREYQSVAGKYAADGFLVKAMAICKVILKIDPDHTETQEALANLYTDQSPSGVLPASMTGALGGPSLRITPARAEPKQPTKPPRAVVPSMPMPSAMPAVDLKDLDSGSVPRASAGVDFAAHEEPRDDVDDTLDVPPPEGTTNTASGVTPLPGATAPGATGVPGLPGQGPAGGLTPLPGAGVAAAEAPSEPDAVPEEQDTLDADAEDDDPDTLVLGLFDADAMMSELEGEPAAQAAEYIDLVDDEEDGDDDEAGGEMTSGEVEILVAPQADTEEMSVDVSRFPPIPLFRELDKKSFVAMFDRLDIKSVQAGERLIEEGATTTSMFILAQGEVRVFRTKDDDVTELARLSDGSFFGEIALLSDAPRMASVESTRPTLLFEMTRDHVAELVTLYPSVSDVLGRFYRERFLANLVRSNPLLFQPLSDDEKRDVFEHFQSVVVSPGTIILQKGEMGQGLYLILRGECDVVDAAPDGRLFRFPVLREGDFFGEMSLLLGAPVNATVKARTTCTVLRLPREIFYERVMRHPEVRKVITTTTNERLKQQAEIETAHTKDDPVLV